MSSQATSTPANAALAGKYLTVALGDESYGIAVLRILEIVRMQKITPVPRMPDFVKGVLNLRGRVIPVVDLRIKFGLAAVINEGTCVVVVQVPRQGAKALEMGVIVDGVEEVVNIPASEIGEKPDFGVQVDTSYLLGMTKVKGQVKMLLDIERVVAPEAIEALAHVA